MADRAYRGLRLTSPYLHGPDVKHLQRSVNARLHARGFAPISTDGVYGRDTSRAAGQALYLLGAPNSADNKGLTIYLQSVIRRPALRPPQWRQRARERKHAHDQIAGRVKALIDWARSQVGVTEHPAGSNRGPVVSRYQREFGIDGQPWCGAFVGFGLRRIAGFHVLAGIVYTPNILNWAHANLNGFSFHSDPEPGDLALFKWPGVSHDSCDHVGLVIDKQGATIEGNTSSGDAGSQNNGGIVAQRQRGKNGLVGYARPSYR